MIFVSSTALLNYITVIVFSTAIVKIEQGQTLTSQNTPNTSPRCQVLDLFISIYGDML